MNLGRRVLVAGIGNVFLGDDGFGVAVAERLAARELPAGVDVGDYGTSGMHLAYDMLGGYDTTVLVDAAPRGEPPGTVSLIEWQPGRETLARTPIDAHGMQPDAVLALLAELGGRPGRVLVVGCEPAEVADRMGLSAAVEAAVPRAVDLLTDLLTRAGDRRSTAPG